MARAAPAPPPDDGVLHPRENPDLFGHGAAEAAFMEAARAGRLAHAWLVTGPAGVGKATFAFRAARWLFAGAAGETMRVEPGSTLFRRVAAGTHADLSVVERSINPETKKLRGEIVVDDVRAATGKFRMTAAEGGFRAIVIDRADEMNRSAANALLKMLEEPPPRAILFLIAEAPGRLLPTIRSRCRRLTLDPLDEAAMARALSVLAPDLDAGERGALGRAGEGSPGAALTLAGADGAAMAGVVEGLLADPARVTGARAYAVAEIAAKTDEAFDLFMTLLRAAIARATRAAARGARGASLDRATRVWHALGPLHRDTLRAHLDKREAVFQAVMALHPDSP